MSSVVEQPVTFRNRNGYRLFGMLYVPKEHAARHIGIVICVNAVKYRTGTFRLHVLLARRLAAIGFHVLTFDPAGIGDSEGPFENKLLTEHYYDIQDGKYNQDLKDACDFFSEQGAFESLLLLGLCGGAISVLMEAAADARVSGLVLLNLPVLMEDLKRLDRENNAAKITSKEEASRILALKLRKLGQWAFWRRFFVLRVDVREEVSLVAKSFSVLARKSAAKLLRLVPSVRAGIDPHRPVSSNPLFNMHFQRSFFAAMRSGKRILFVFAEHDPWTWIFKSEFQDRVLQPGHPYERQCCIELVPGANHIFSASESCRQLEQRVVTWLDARYPRRAEAA